MTPARPVTAAPPPTMSDENRPAKPSHRPLSFDALDGWQEDDHAAALAAFLETCDLPQGPEWQSIAEAARSGPEPRAFFERFFQPVLIGDGPALFTGYYEPEAPGSLTRTDRFSQPIHARPDHLPTDRPWVTRAEIETGGLLEGQGLEIAWLEDRVEAFFLQVQGSGRIRLPDGRALRVAYDGRNGQPYRSIGQEMLQRGILAEGQMSAAAIKIWLRANPDEGRLLLHHNPSYVFFRVLQDQPEGMGPLGAMNRPVTAGRSIAVDPAFTPLGAPVWIEIDGSAPVRRLTVAQDTGSAITGPQRADLFCGSGETAGEMAGRMRDPGRMVVLMPRRAPD